MKTKMNVRQMSNEEWAQGVRSEPITIGYVDSLEGRCGLALWGKYVFYAAYVGDVEFELNLKNRWGADKLLVNNHLIERVEKKLSKGQSKLLLVGNYFERSVWLALMKIPYGRTVTYQWVADKIGKPKAARAVGSAIGRNPITRWVPCHRVVRSDGGLGGYAYGVEIKQKLLASEMPQILA